MVVASGSVSMPFQDEGPVIIAPSGILTVVIMPFEVEDASVDVETVAEIELSGLVDVASEMNLGGGGEMTEMLNPRPLVTV